MVGDERGDEADELWATTETGVEVMVVQGVTKSAVEDNVVSGEDTTTSTGAGWASGGESGAAGDRGEMAEDTADEDEDEVEWVELAQLNSE